MSEKYSDVLIVGTDLAGLVTGAFLAKRGLSVTVLNFERDVSLEKKNIQPNLITHLESRLFKSILGRLSILDHELNIIRKLDVPYQVVLPRHRIDVYRDRERFYRELKREFPDSQENLKALFESLDHFDATLDAEALQELILPHSFKRRWKFSKFIKNTGLNQRIADFTDHLANNAEVRTFLESQLKLLSKTHSPNPFTYQIAKALGNDNSVLFEVKGGIGHLKKLFLDKIEAYAGKVKNEVRLEGFNFEKRKAAAVRLGGFEGVIGCRYLLWNEEIRKIVPFFPKNLWTRRLIKRIEAIRPQYYHFSIQFEVDPQIIPIGMRENLIDIGDPEQELAGANFLHLNHYRPAEPEHAGKAYLTVSYFLQAKYLDEPASFFDKLHGMIAERLQKLMPFSKDKIRLSFPLEEKPAEDEGTLFTMEKSDFEIFRENAQGNPIYETKPQSFGDLFPIPNRTLFKNLYFTSPEILSSLGFEGKFLLGLKTIDLIWNEVEGSQKKAIKQRKIA